MPLPGIPFFGPRAARADGSGDSESATETKEANPSRQEEDGGEGKGATATEPRPATRQKGKSKPLPPFHVVLLDDNDHTHEYVVTMLRSLFGHPPHVGWTMADQVDRTGRVVVLTTHKEKAELKRDQIHAYGADPNIPTCKGSMSAIIQAAEAD